MLKNYLMVFFISMVPVIELRGAIPIGLGMGLPALPTYLVCVLGNMLPVPFIYLFARKFLIWGYHKPVIGPICRFFIVKGEKFSLPAWAVCCWRASSWVWPAPVCWARPAACLQCDKFGLRRDSSPGRGAKFCLAY